VAGESFWKRLFGGRPAAIVEGPPAPAPAPAAPAFDFNDARIPDVAREQVATIRTLISGLETRAIQKASAQELAELRQIAEVYLPKLLRSYIDIPPDARAEIYRQTGRSASYALKDRLQTIEDRVREISHLLAQEDLAAFHQNMRFIDQRFGKSPFDI
jgi:hypothetical protein